MTLHEQIAKALGWSLQDTLSLSLQSLRDLVRPLNPKLAQEITLYIQNGSYLTKKP